MRPPLALVFALALASPARGDAPPPEPARPIAAWLAHKEWTVRSVCAFGLRRRMEPGVIGPLTGALRVEQDAVLRIQLLGALEGRPRRELVAEGGCALADALVALLDAPEPAVRSRALRLLARIPPIPLGERAELLRGWWARGKDALEREQARLKAEPPAPVGETPPAAGESQTVERASPDLVALLESHARDGLEIVLVIDSTGSMGPVIAAAKSQCRALVSRLRRLVPQLRVGLVTYDDGARLRAPLTSDAEELQKALDAVVAAGGGDVEEGVDKGIRLAMRQEQVGWSRKAHRLAIVVGDAPPHEGDVKPLLTRLVAAAEDELFEHGIVVHTVSTAVDGVPHFGSIARAGRGAHVTLGRTDLLAHELVLLTFGGSHRAFAEAWIEDVDRVDALLASR